jgi:small subunit ribosomal protein S4
VSIDGRKVTIPGYIVKRGEEEKIDFNAHSPISNELHPLRTVGQPSPAPEAPGHRAEEHLNAQEEKVVKELKKVAADVVEEGPADLPELPADIKEE